MCFSTEKIIFAQRIYFCITVIKLRVEMYCIVIYVFIYLFISLIFIVISFKGYF